MEIKRKPNWLRIAVSQGSNFTKTFETILSSGVDTVCQNAKCPNRSDCWSRGTATFMILGGICTRDCAFCAVGHGTPLAPNPDEPDAVANAVAKLALKCAVITSATRDDIADGGAEHWAKTVLAIRKKSPDTKIEILTPDFCGDKAALETVFKSRPDVFSHNVETVERLQKSIRKKADYQTSLGVLAAACKYGLRVKSSIMLGLGETESEIASCIEDIRETGASMISIGQYLQPSKNHAPLSRWVEPDEFKYWGEFARQRGFDFVMSAPLVRSSYHADEAF